MWPCSWPWIKLKRQELFIDVKEFHEFESSQSKPFCNHNFLSFYEIHQHVCHYFFIISKCVEWHASKLKFVMPPFLSLLASVFHQHFLAAAIHIWLSFHHCSRFSFSLSDFVLVTVSHLYCRHRCFHLFQNG